MRERKSRRAKLSGNEKIHFALTRFGGNKIATTVMKS